MTRRSCLTAYSEAYLKEHIIASLDAFFKVAEEITADTFVDANGTQLPLFSVNDVADDDCMLDFAIIGIQYDVFKLAYYGRTKG